MPERFFTHDRHVIGSRLFRKLGKLFCWQLCYKAASGDIVARRMIELAVDKTWHDLVSDISESPLNNKTAMRA